MGTSPDENRATTRALPALASLTRKEEQPFLSTINMLLQASPKRRRERIDQIGESASGSGEMSASSLAYGNERE